MQALTLMIVYVLTTISLQFFGFLISRLVDYEWPTLGLMSFLILFMAAFGIAWPIAVRIAEFLIRRAGHVVETAQSGGYVVEERKVAPSGVTPGGDAPGRMPAKAACAATAWRWGEPCGKSRKILFQENA